MAIDTTLYIDMLPTTIQKNILAELKKLNLSKEDIHRAMCSRLCDLSDTINIKKYIK